MKIAIVFLMCCLLDAGRGCDTDACETCDTGYKCRVCRPGFYKGTDGICNKCHQDCYRCSPGNTCDQCKVGYYKQTYGIFTVCSPCPTHCKSCDSDTYCESCKTGYYGVTCSHSCQQHCVNGKCAKDWCIVDCKDGYYMDSNTCKACSPNCASCSSDTYCSRCDAGYYKPNTNTQSQYCVQQCSSFCSRCTSSTQCDACQTGYYTYKYPSGEIECLQCSTNCLDCISDTQCTACDIGYFPNGGTCSACSSLCKACVSTSSQCTECQSDYYLYRGTCTTCSIEGQYVDQHDQCSECSFPCKSCASTSTQCTECHSGHYLDGDTCKTCQEGNYLDLTGHCYACSSPCKACATTNNQCTTCHNGHYLDVEACTRCPNGCAECSSKYTCSSCSYGFYKSGKTCDQCPSKCTTCTSSSRCTACGPGHQLESEQCVKVCSAGQYAESDQCHQCPQTCSTCSSADRCDKCNPGYQLKSNQCVNPCKRGCKDQQCDADGNCMNGCVSSSRYGPKCDKICANEYANCSECNADSCELCNSGYFLHSGTCSQCSNNCKNGAECHPQDGTCIDGCKETWTGHTCSEKCPRNCTACKQIESDTCLTCSRGFHGTSCENRCSEHCNRSSTVHEICFKDNGTCSIGCVKGHWGPMCDNVCSNGCADKRQCSTDDGRCKRCKIKRYGDHCKLECSNTCNNPHNGSNICDRRTGACLYRCTSGIGGATCGEDGSTAKGNVDGSDTRDNTAMIAGVVGGVVVLTVGVVAVVCIVKRRRRNRKSLNTEEAPVPMTENDEVTDPAGMNLNPVPAKREESVLMEASGPSSSRISTSVRMSELPSHGLAADTDEIDLEIEEDEHGVIPAPVPVQTSDTYYNIAGLVRSRIDVDKLQEYVNKKTNKDFMKEFMKFPTGLIRPYNAAMQNIANNRYQNIYPYDASRVVLKSGPSDYINASYINSYSQYNTYIASLGPTNKTMPDYVRFWTMVWQENVEVIVMVTNLMEGTTMKCEQYWPGPGTSMTYGDVTVTCHSEDVYAEYTVRSFTVQLQTTDTRTLHHIHFTAWPDKGVPDDVTSLIEFRHRVITCPMKLDGPTLVHCSAGIGRTGTYIALDILTREGRAEKSVDVFGCVMAMRGLRVNMVQTAEQYEYLHNALVHTLTFDCDPIQADKVRQLLTPSHTSTMHAQFEHLQHTTDVISADEKKAIAANKALPKKNRPVAEIPGRRHRPWLHLLRKSGSSNYINAVFVNSFKQKDRYVVAQTPLPTTVEDFLTLVMQTDCPCIVSLDDITQRDKTVGVYIPAVNEVSKHGIFQVKSISSETTPHYTLRQLEISTHGKNSQEPRSVYHFQCTMWGREDKVPKDSTAFLQLTREVDRMSLKAVDTGSIVVHCLTGAERSGLFCVVSVLIQKMEIEHQVSVVNTVRQVKARRRRAIPDKVQYQFCHECLSAYIQSFNTYSNFAQ